MRILIQRVSGASVSVEGEVVGKIDAGLCLLVGVGHEDSRATLEAMASKVVNLRIFSDERGRFDRTLLDVGGGVLAISQFTLFADCRKGRRPSFIDAARPEHAEPMFDAFVQILRELGVGLVETGRFGQMMAVEIHNDGPVTIWLNSSDLGVG